MYKDTRMYKIANVRRYDVLKIVTSLMYLSLDETFIFSLFSFITFQICPPQK